VKVKSGAWNLIKNKGWSAVLIEANPVFFEKLQKEYSGNSQVHAVQAYVGFEGENTLDAILKREAVPHELDFISIDIDGADYHVWDALKEFQPRVVMIECNLRIPSDIVFVQAKDMQVGQGSSLKALVELGKKKGYELLYAGDMNAFFVLKDLFPKFGIEDNSLESFEYAESGARFFQLFDGSVVLTGVPADQLLLYKKVSVHPLSVMQGGEVKQIPLNKESALVRLIKELIKKIPLYNKFIYPLARRFYGKTWRAKQAVLRRIGERER
jgi:hypothetical protein